MNNENQNQNPTATEAKKTKIYNIIILDRSGSMGAIQQGAVSGYNELIDSIRQAAQENAATQEHSVSLVTFNDRPEVLYRELPADKTTDLTTGTYRPRGCTALYDAMGFTLTEAEKVVDREEDAIGVVTIITDGYENASRHFSGQMAAMLVERLKEKGWTFAFMGTNIDVIGTAAALKIDHSMAFACTDEGIHGSWEADADAKKRQFARMAAEHQMTSAMNKEERHRHYRMRQMQERYFADEKKPENEQPK